MSSTLDTSSVLATIAALESQLAALKAQLLGGKAAPVVTADKPAVTKAKKERKASNAPPTAWRIFADRVRDLLRAHGYTAKALGVECVQFAATLKDENSDLNAWMDADILARRAAWSAPTVSKWEAKHGEERAAAKATKAASKASSKASSVVSGPAEDKPKKERKNPWAGLSDEERKAKSAKMAAAKAAKKAGTTVTEPVPVSDTNTTVAPVTTDTSAGFQRMSLHGKPYWVNHTSGHCYERNKDGSQGNWAGIFHRSGGPVEGGPYIDDSAAEPMIDGWDNDELVF